MPAFEMYVTFLNFWKIPVRNREKIHGNLDFNGNFNSKKNNNKNLCNTCVSTF